MDAGYLKPLQDMDDANRPLFKLHCHIKIGPGEPERIYVTSPDGRQVVTIASDGCGFDLWDMVKGESIHCSAETGGAVTTAVFSSDGLYIVAGSQNGMIRLWSKFGQEIGLYHKHTGPVEELRFLPGDESFISVGGDGEVRRWWLEQDKGSCLLARFRMGVEGLAISSDGRGLFVMGDGIINKTRIVAYDLEKEQAFWVVDGSGKDPTEWEQSDSFVFALDRRVLVGRSTTDNRIRTWNFYTGGDLCEIPYPDEEQLTHLQVMPGNDWYLVLASSCWSMEGKPLSFLRIWNVGRSWLIADVLTYQDRITAIGLDEDGDLVASGGADGSIMLWRLIDGAHIKTFSGHVGKVLAIGLSPDGRFQLSCGEDGVVRLWEVETGRNLAQYTLAESVPVETASVGFTWDNRFAYCIGSDVWFFQLKYP